MDQQASDVSVAALADCEQRGLAAGGVLLWHQARPCGKVTGTPELPPITDCRQQRSRCQWPDARDGQETPGTLVTARDLLDLSCKTGDPLIEADELGEEIGQYLSHCWREIIVLVGKDARKITSEEAGALWEGDAVLEAKGPHLVDQGGSIGDHLVAYAMSRLQVDPARRFADG